MKQKELHKRYIKNTEKGALVKEVRALLCHLGKWVRNILRVTEYKIYIKTRVLKHLYDRRNAQEYDFILENLMTIVKSPDKLYLNKSEKRGEFVFYKNINNRGILCSIQKNETDDSFDIVTAFTGKDLTSYLKNFEILYPPEGLPLEQD